MPADALNSATVSLLGPGNHGKELLYKSVDLGRIKTVKTLLNAGVQPFPSVRISHRGASSGQIEMIKLGIARGEDINAFAYGTPLMSAIDNKQLPAIEFLLANGATASEWDKKRISDLKTELVKP
jgi:hypothetical protein